MSKLATSVLALALFACRPAAELQPAGQPAAGVEAAGRCPTTRPADPPFEPPLPYPPQAPWAGEFWHGTAELWTALPESGIWSGLPFGPGGYTQKLFWWRPGYEASQEPEPALEVAGRRLGDSRQAFTAGPATNASAEDIQTAMLVGIEIPAAGCWEITGRYQNSEVIFVVLVEP